MAFKKDAQIHLTELRPDQASDRNILPQAEQPALAEWPSTPQPLTNEPLVDRFLDAYDVMLCLVPLLLIAKIILVIVVYHSDLGSAGVFVDEVGILTTFLVQFNNQLTTAFTIVFVLIISTLMRRLALFRAQHGESVAQLEQFQASISLPSTLKTIWSLRAFSLTSLVLVLIWSFYYLGSQASQREFQLVDSEPFKKMTIATISASAPSVFQSANLSILSSSQRLFLNEAYALAVLSQTNTNNFNGFDINGAVLVPWLGQEEDYLNADRYGWYDVHVVSSDQLVRSSYAGFQVWTPDGINDYNVQSVGKYTFNTSYLALDCSEPTLANGSAFPSGTLPSLSMSLNMTNQIGEPGTSNSDIPRNLDVWSRFSEYAVHVTCGMTMEYVEVQVRCGARGCVTQKMRKTRGSPSLYRTPFDDDQFAESFFNEFLLSSGTSASFDNTSLVLQVSGLPGTEITLNEPGEPFNPDHYRGNAVGYWLTPSINTYYQLSQNPFTFDNFRTVSAAIPGILTGNQTKYSSFFSTTKMKGAPYNPHYALSIAWIIVDFISCNILFAAAIACFCLRKWTLAPDIFGYVSSLTRDNPDLHLPDGGTTLSGLERARLLKDVKICIADVDPSEGIGRVGLSYARSESWQQEHLTRDRHYI